MRAAFVTATGTEIGKTFVTTGLIRALRRQGRPVRALKPVASGYDPTSRDSDTAVLLAALEAPDVPDQVAAISPWRFRAPLSPDRAARLEGSRIPFETLVGFCRDAVTRDSDAVLLIEGIGGVMVPLDERHTVLDWIQALDVPVILVCGSYLGALSHTLTAAGMLAARRLRVVAAVVNETAGSSIGLDDTASTISRFVAADRVLMLPRLGPAASAHPTFESLADLF